ncbi:MAG: hypothetical protein ACI4E1_15090 [Lachnospira sp.]
MWKNDSTYIGTAKNEDFYFLSPIAELDVGEDEFDRKWVHLSDELKSELKLFLKELNDKHKMSLPVNDKFTSYDNPDYLWISYELENLRRLYNNAMINPTTGKLIEGRKFIPYIQLCLKSTAFSVESLYPKSTINMYGKEYNPHYVIEFQQPFLKSFINFVCSVFDDNPQIYKEVGGKKIITHQYVAPIYRLPPFDKCFECRHDLPGIIISKAVEMLLAHEIAHIGNGHLRLNAKDKDTIITEENDADIQAICWVLGCRFLECDGSILDITYDDLKQELALSIFAVYLLYTWTYSKERRIWSENTIKEYGNQSHLPYQLRAFTIINTSRSRLNNLGIWSKECKIKTLDGIYLEPNFFDKVFQECIYMINSFERSLHMFFSKTEDVYNLSLDNKFDELRKMAFEEKDGIYSPLTKQNIPWLLGLEPEGQAELKRVNDLWESVRERLIDNGTYCKLRPYKEWIPHV